MVLVSVSIHEARVSSTFFGGLKASRRWKLKKIIIWENIESNELSLVFSKIVSKGLCCDKVWGISIFPSCTPIRGIYRKSLLISFRVIVGLTEWIHFTFSGGNPGTNFRCYCPLLVWVCIILGGRWNSLFTSCLPFTTNSRNFRLGYKWYTIFWFVPLENSPNKWKFWKGSPILPIGTFRMEIRLPFTSFLSFVPVSCCN